MWKVYETIHSRGFVSVNNSTNIISVIEDDYIFFYEIDLKTYVPQVRNVMNNFMQCGMIVFGEASRFCITYKPNQPNFLKYKRKMEHDFRVRVNSENFEDAKGFNLLNNFYFLVIKPLGEIVIFDQDTYKEEYRLKITLDKSDTREHVQILS